MNATFFVCPFSYIYCETFNCQKMAKWYIGREDGPVSTTHKLCDECAKNLIATAPAQLVAGGSDLKEQIEAECSMQHEQKIAALKENFETVAKAQQATIGELIAKLREQSAQAVTVEEKPPDEAAVKGAIYRCLECDREFASKANLASHMRTHK